MSDAIDVIYRLRDMAKDAADNLREAMGAAQAKLDRLDTFVLDFENLIDKAGEPAKGSA